MTARFDRTIVVVLVMSMAACGDDDAMPSSDAGMLSVDERFDALASAKGCNASNVIDLPPACVPLVINWLDCVERDLAQCICEANDNDLNCEGSYKPNEGPALCITEFNAADSCIEGGQ